LKLDAIKDGNLSLSIGRVNFDQKKIIDNYKSVLETLGQRYSRA
jgi:ribosomal protein L1